ncbi:hypothetical protein [Actinocorallia longicatena]|uniref:Uncharacterized protein n=1 Tax=Actinocorallia longicatena TaxID=111803 RepID=A0ABP6QFQ1_9ACTN
MNVTEANDTNTVVKALLGMREPDEKVREAVVRLSGRVRQRLHVGVHEREIPAVLPDLRAALLSPSGELFAVAAKAWRDDARQRGTVAHDAALTPDDALVGLLAKVFRIVGPAIVAHVDGGGKAVSAAPDEVKELRSMVAQLRRDARGVPGPVAQEIRAIVTAVQNDGLGTAAACTRLLQVAAGEF